MKKVQGTFSISRTQSNYGPDTFTIRLEDTKARIVFAEAVVTPEDLALALSGRSDLSCLITCRGLDLVGKVRELQRITLDADSVSHGNRPQAREAVTSHLKESGLAAQGWVCNDDLNAQDSITWLGEDRVYIRARITRWVDPDA